MAAGTLSHEREAGFFARLDAAVPARNPAMAGFGRARATCQTADFAAKLLATGASGGAMPRIRVAFSESIARVSPIEAERDGRLCGS